MEEADRKWGWGEGTLGLFTISGFHGVEGLVGGRGQGIGWNE